jgi:hypothetical protein
MAEIDGVAAPLETPGNHGNVSRVAALSDQHAAASRHVIARIKGVPPPALSKAAFCNQRPQSLDRIPRVYGAMGPLGARSPVSTAMVEGAIVLRMN